MPASVLTQEVRHVFDASAERDLICRAGNLRAVQLLLDRARIESTVCYLGVEVDDAFEIAEKIDV